MPETAEYEQMDQMITGYWISQAVYAAAKFNIADHLKDGPRTVEELASDTNTDPTALYRLLRALASRGTFAETDDFFSHRAENGTTGRMMGYVSLV